MNGMGLNNDIKQSIWLQEELENVTMKLFLDADRCQGIFWSLKLTGFWSMSMWKYVFIKNMFLWKI